MLGLEGSFTIFLSSLLFVTAQADDRGQSAEKQIIYELDHVHRQVKSLDDSLQRLRSIVDNAADCHLNINAPFCMDSDMQSKLDAMNILKDGTNPGKRSELDGIQSFRVKRYLQDLSRKRLMLNDIQSLLYDMARKLHEERKRSCTLNLAYHCKTSEYSAITDMYNYLNSNKSPGKRKRSIGQHLEKTDD